MGLLVLRKLGPVVRIRMPDASPYRNGRSTHLTARSTNTQKPCRAREFIGAIDHLCCDAGAVDDEVRPCGDTSERPCDELIHPRWECDELLCHAQAKAHQINGEGGGT